MKPQNLIKKIATLIEKNQEEAEHAKLNKDCMTFSRHEVFTTRQPQCIYFSVRTVKSIKLRSISPPIQTVLSCTRSSRGGGGISKAYAKETPLEMAQDFVLMLVEGNHNQFDLQRIHFGIYQDENYWKEIIENIKASIRDAQEHMKTLTEKSHIEAHKEYIQRGEEQLKETRQAYQEWQDSHQTLEQKARWLI